MVIKRSVKFLLHKRKAGESVGLAIRMRVTLRGERPFDFPLGLKVDSDKWDSVAERAVDGAKEATGINRTIEEYRANINEVFARYELLEKRIPSPQEVKELFNDMIGKKPTFEKNDRISLMNALNLFTTQSGKKNQWTPATYQKFKTLRQHLEHFAPGLAIDDLTDEKMQEYVSHLYANGLRNTTISKHIALLRWFLRWASQSGHYSGNTHQTFKPKLKGVSVNSKEIIYLSQEELQKIREYTFSEEQKALEQVRDVFLFQCFTGLRYSDVEKLKRSDVKNGIIKVVTKKTVDGLRIELNKHSQAIIDKYSIFKFPKDSVLPVISNQKMNAHLKTIGQLVGLEEPTRVVYFRGNQRYEEVYPKWCLLTTHVARRTFVVTALQLGIPVEVIMRWTGHSNFEAMKPYAKIVDELKERSMSKFDTL